MYTSTQTRSENLQSSQGVNQRWCLQMPFVNFKQKPILGEDHTSVVVSMREHIMPLQKVYKGDTATHARNLLTQGAWGVVVDAMKAHNKQSKAFYTGSRRLHDCVEQIATGFKDKGFKRVVLMVHPSGNAKQIESLTALLRHNGLSVSHQYVGCDVFLKETLIFGDERPPVHWPAHEPALHLLQHIRDEAHRFAITGHRARRAKARQPSLLNQIPQVGAKRRQALLQHFGGIAGVLAADENALARVEGISPALAASIWAALHNG